MRYLLVFIAIILSSSCTCDRKPDSQNLLIVNNSKSNIYVFSSETDLLEVPYRTYSGIPPSDYQHKVGTAKNLFDRPNMWQYSIDNSLGGVLRIFVVNQELADQYGWSTIFDRHLYSKVYIVNMDTLESHHWTITYTGK